MVKKELIDYLEEQIGMRGWSRRELSRRAGISNSSVLRAFGNNPDKPPGYDILASIARALRIHPMTLFIKAGLMPREPKQTTALRHLVHTFEQLPEEHQHAAILYIDYLFTQRSKLFPMFPDVEDE